jgi:hypothetical protein
MADKEGRERGERICKRQNQLFGKGCGKSHLVQKAVSGDFLKKSYEKVKE